MLNTTNFPQPRLKQMLADIDKAWSEIDELYYDIGGGQLQCTATHTNAVGAKRIKIWIKDLP